MRFQRDFRLFRLITRAIRQKISHFFDVSCKGLQASQKHSQNKTKQKNQQQKESLITFCS